MGSLTEFRQELVERSDGLIAFLLGKKQPFDEFFHVRLIEHSALNQILRIIEEVDGGKRWSTRSRQQVHLTLKVAQIIWHGDCLDRDGSPVLSHLRGEIQLSGHRSFETADDSVRAYVASNALSVISLLQISPSHALLPPGNGNSGSDAKNTANGLNPSGLRLRLQRAPTDKRAIHATPCDLWSGA